MSGKAGLLVAAGAMVALLGYAVWERTGSAWATLHARYPASGGWGEFRQQRTVEFRAGSEFAISRYPQRVTAEWRESSVFLGQTAHFLGRRFDLDPIYPPIRVPASSIRTCTQKPISGDWGVELWVEEAGVRIGFPGYGRSVDQTILDWCRAEGIPIVNETGDGRGQESARR